MSSTVSSVNVVVLAALASCRLFAEANPEVTAKAVLVPCQELPSEPSRSGSAVEGFLSSKPTLTGCKRKLGIVLRINNTGQFQSEDMYVFLDEAIDRATNESVKLLEPIVVKMHQHPVVLAHAFHYLGSVSGELAETVYTAKNLTEPDSLGACYSNDIASFQCGYDMDEMFPKGFCCPCAEQECAPTSRERPCTPKETTPTTHCLRESPYWYFATALAPAVVYHALEMHIFKKAGPQSWTRVTGPEGAFVSTDYPTSSSEDGTVVAKYLSSAEPYVAGESGLPFESHRLLIPHYIPGMTPDNLPPHMKNGARDYLVVPNHLLDLGDTQCSKVGSYFKAFWNQENRCQQPVGSCLELQPLDLWSQDNELRSQGKKGKYLLENFARPMRDPILVNEKTGRRYLALEYDGHLLSMAFLEISADGLKFHTPDPEQSLTEVTTTAMTNPIVIRLYATNTGHKPAQVRAVIQGCSFGFGSASTDLVPLTPGQKKLMLLTLHVEGSMPTADVWCNVALEGEGHRFITSRSVLIRPKGRCMCYLHCQCTCLGEPLTCKEDTSASREKRHTEFQAKTRVPGHVAATPQTTTTTRSRPFYVVPEPFRATPPEMPGTVDPLSCSLSTTIILLEIILSIGLFKATVGLTSTSVATWGLRSYIAQIEKSDSSESRSSSTFEMDEEKRVSTGAIFCMNLFCFCMLPFILLARKRKGSYHRIQREEMEDKIFGFEAARSTKK